MAADDDRPDDWPRDAVWPPEDVWLADDDLPDIVATGELPPAGVRTLTWSATLLGPLLLWGLGFWLAGLGRPDRRDPGCGGFCLTAQEEVWFTGAAYGLVAVPAATLVGAVAVALVAPARRLGAAIGVLAVDLLALGLLTASLAEAAPDEARPADPTDQVMEAS